MLKGHSGPPHPQFCIHGFNQLWIIYSKVLLKQIHIKVDRPLQFPAVLSGYTVLASEHPSLKFRKNMTNVNNVHNAVKVA